MDDFDFDDQNGGTRSPSDSPDDLLDFRSPIVKHSQSKIKHKQKNRNDQKLKKHKSKRGHGSPSRTSKGHLVSKNTKKKIEETDEKWLKSYKIPKMENLEPVILDRRNSLENAHFDIDLEDSSCYWTGIELKIFQNKDIASLLDLSQTYIMKDFFTNPIKALTSYIMQNVDKKKHLPFLAQKILAYSTNKGAYQAKALINAFKLCNFSSTDIEEYYQSNLHCPTELPFCEKALHLLLLSTDQSTCNHIEEMQAQNLIQQTGGPVYCTCSL